MLKTENRQQIDAFIIYQCQAINYAFLANAPKTKRKSYVPQKVLRTPQNLGTKDTHQKKNNYKEEEKGEKRKKKGNEESKLGSSEASP